METSTDLSAFIRREHPRLVGALTVHCGDRALAEDIAQEALARVCDRWSQVSAMEHPTAWLYRTAMNLSSSWFRRRGAELRAYARHRSGETSAATDELGAAADVIALRQSIRKLPAQQRTALVYRYYLDLPASEVAVLMQTSEAAVRQVTSRAIAALRPRFTSSTVESEAWSA